MIAAKIFTFHNVSINSINGLISSVTQNSFTFHNVSINSLCQKQKQLSIQNLHSIMYLLIQGLGLAVMLGNTIYIP